MSRLSGGLFGSLYDPERNRRTTSVFNQQPTGVGGQAASFAAAQEAERARQAQQLAAAQAAAQQQQQAVAAEAAAAQQRQEQARATAQQEQEFKLRQAQFENEKAIEAQRLAESKRAANATEAARQNQQRLAKGTASQQQYQRALGGSSMAQSGVNHSARLKGQLSPFSNLLTPGAYSQELSMVARGNGPQSGQALQGLNQNRTGLGYKPISKNRLSRWGNGASYNIAATKNRGSSGAFGSGAANAFQR